MRNLKILTFISFLIIIFAGCEKEEYKVEYTVSSGKNLFPARIVFQNEMNDEQTLQEQELPWTYQFTGEEGNEVKIAAKAFSTGNITLIGTDTLNVTISVNGSVYKEDIGIINNAGSVEIVVSGKL